MAIYILTNGKNEGIFKMKNKKIISTIIVLLSIGFLCGSLFAEDAAQDTKKYVVTSNAYSGKGTLFEGVKSGAAEVFFERSMTIELTSTISIPNSVNIYGTTPNGEALDIIITIKPGLQFPMLLIYSENVNLTFKNITFTNGNGGAIEFCSDGGNLTIANCTFTSNEGGRCGAINSHGNVTITDSTFTSNKAESDGGAVRVSKNGNLTITNSTFTSNSGDFGGAIHVISGNVAITNSTFTSNSAKRRAGAVAVAFGKLAVDDSIFTSNSTNEGVGGAVSVQDGAATITNCTFASNSASSNHGGAVAVSSGNLTIIGSTFTLNSAYAQLSQAVYVISGNPESGPLSTLNIINSTFYQNTTDEKSGNIYLIRGTLNLLNSIVFGDICLHNVSPHPDRVVFNSAFNIIGGTVAGDYKQGQGIDIENNAAATSEEVFLTGELEGNALKINQSGPASGTGVWVGHQDNFEVINYSVPGSDIWTPFVGDFNGKPANIIKNSNRGAVTSEK